MTDVLDRRALGRATLARQLLLARADVGVPAAVERVGGLQAQEPAPPFTGLWSRVAGFSSEDLRSALLAREVVRAPWLRATLHLVSAADYAAFRTTLQPALTSGLSVLGTRAAGLDVAAVVPVARRLLAEEPRPFPALRSALVAAFPDVHERALGFAARMCLPVVMVPTGAPKGFPPAAAVAVAEEWLRAPLVAEADVEGLALRYLAAFGPASAADLSTWSGLGAAAAVLEGLRPRLRVFRAEDTGRQLFDLPDAPRPDADVPAPARFLPEFDNLVLAHADRSRVVPDEHRRRLVTQNLRVRATFLWDGLVRGTWAVTSSRRAAALTLTPFAPLPAVAVDQLGGEGQVLLGFLAPGAADRDVRVEAVA